jgi:hypothetical protein
MDALVPRREHSIIRRRELDHRQEEPLHHLVGPPRIRCIGHLHLHEIRYSLRAVVGGHGRVEHDGVDVAVPSMDLHVEPGLTVGDEPGLGELERRVPRHRAIIRLVPHLHRRVLVDHLLLRTSRIAPATIVSRR